MSDITSYLQDNIDNIVIIAVIIITLLVLFSMLNINFNSKSTVKHATVMEKFDTKEGGDSFGKAFCEINKGNPHDQETSCQKLNQSNCNATGCCVWVNGEKCAAGNKNGPTFHGTQSDPLKIEKYHYKNQLFTS